MIMMVMIIMIMIFMNLTNQMYYTNSCMIFATMMAKKIIITMIIPMIIPLKVTHIYNYNYYIKKIIYKRD